MFFNQQHKAHFPILNYLKDGDNILWVGGGAGKFIPELDKLNLNLQIDYIDFSQKMIGLAQKQMTKNVKINYIVSDIFDVKLTKEYDVVFTTFLFDHFNQSKAEILFNQLNSVLKSDGLWFYVDFSQNQNLWQKGLTKLMLNFFRLLIGLDITQLPKMDKVFKYNLDKIVHQHYFMKYIESVVYKKK